MTVKTVTSQNEREEYYYNDKLHNENEPQSTIQVGRTLYYKKK